MQPSPIRNRRFVPVRTILASLLFNGTVLPADPAEIPGVVEAVTVYRGQALVTREIEVPGPEGLRELIVTDLPEQIVPGSLYAELREGGLVRSVRYRVRPQSHDVRDEVRKIDEQIRTVQDELQTIAKNRQVIGENKVYLGNLEQFAASSATTELQHGILDADTLKDLTLFLEEQRSKLAEEDIRSTFEERDLREKLDVLQRERLVLTGGSARTAREAVVFLNVADAKGVTLRLRYLVNGAHWTPSFNVRADAKKEQVAVEYYASIQQLSGEDWSNVAMTLSTATPSLVSKAPTLSPLAVALTSLSAQQAAAPPALERMMQLQQQKKDAVATRNVAGLGKGLAKAQTEGMLDSEVGGQHTFQSDRLLNQLACEEQVIDILSHGKLARRAEAASAERESLSVTYELADRTTLPSRTDQQLVQIASWPLVGEFYHVATPVLTEYVYAEATVTNSSPMVFLAGPASTYVDGQFVGHGAVPTVTTGQPFTVGLGIDSTLRAGRELVDRVESVQGANRIVEFTYRIALENFGDAFATKVRVLDRIPAGKEVKCTLVHSQVEECPDPTYQKTDRKKGLLRWDVDVPPRSTGAQSKNFEYKFRLEYDKGMMISPTPAVADARN